MTSALTVFDVTDSLESSDRVSARDRRELRQTATSTYSSSIEGGIASPWDSKLSR